MEIKECKTAAILPNPYRKIDRYKLDADKIEALIQSYGSTGFWDGSIQARPTKNGKVEIAFGHHRVEAARQTGIKTLGLSVGPLTNETMLRMMADENREEFKHDRLVSMETIAAVVEAYGAGDIELEPVPRDTRKDLIYEVTGVTSSKPYTLATISRFLGWVNPSDGKASHSCRSAFDLYRASGAVQEAVQTLPSNKRTGEATDTVRRSAKVARAVALLHDTTPARVGPPSQPLVHDTTA